DIVVLRQERPLLRAPEGDQALMSYATKREFLAAVKRAQAGDATAVTEVRRYADDHGRRARAVAAAPISTKRAGRKTKRTAQLTMPPKGPTNRAAVAKAIEVLGLK